MDPTPSSKSILLVEDDADNRAIYRTILEHAGYGVLVAENGEVGVKTALEHRPALVLMDISMPVMSGWDAIRLLKEDPRTAPIPVFALSAHVLLEGAYRAALDAGFESYLTKPVEPKGVLEAVRGRIGEP